MMIKSSLGAIVSSNISIFTSHVLILISLFFFVSSPWLKSPLQDKFSTDVPLKWLNPRLPQVSICLCLSKLYTTTINPQKLTQKGIAWLTILSYERTSFNISLDFQFRDSLYLQK